MVAICIILYLLGAVMFYLVTSTGGEGPDADACDLFWMAMWPVFMLIVGVVILVMYFKSKGGRNGPKLER